MNKNDVYEMAEDVLFYRAVIQVVVIVAAMIGVILGVGVWWFL